MNKKQILNILLLMSFSASNTQGAQEHTSQDSKTTSNKIDVQSTSSTGTATQSKLFKINIGKEPIDHPTSPLTTGDSSQEAKNPEQSTLYAQLMNYIASIEKTAQPDIRFISQKLRPMIKSGNYFGALLYIAALTQALHTDAMEVIKNNPNLQKNISDTVSDFIKQNKPLVEQIKENVTQILLNATEKGYEESMASVAGSAFANIV